MGDLGLQVLFQGNNFLRIMEGLGVTIYISLVSVLLSIVFGLIFGVIMTVENPAIKFLSRLYLEFVRIMPQLVLLFIVYFGLARFLGINLSGAFSAILVFSIWGTAEMGDLVRGAITSIPPHQYESAKAIGLTKKQMYRHIILPQAFRRLLPQAINLVTRMIKTTSLVALIGVVEVIKTGQQVIENVRLTAPMASLWMYALLLFLYFIVCYPISQFSKYLENAWKDGISG